MGMSYANNIQDYLPGIPRNRKYQMTSSRHNKNTDCNHKTPSVIEGAAIVENMLDALTLLDMSGNIIYHNPASLALHGYKTAEEAHLPKSHYIDHWEVSNLNGVSVPVEDWPFSRVLDGQAFSNYELQVRNKVNGKIFTGSYSGKLLRDENSDTQYVMLTIRDISQQKQTEKELRKERLLLQTIYDTIPVMLSIYDPQIEEISLNKHVERVTGWTIEDTQKTHIMNLVYPDPEYRENVAKFMQSLQEGFKDIIMIGKDGRKIQTSWANVQISDGRQVGIGIDISERKLAEQKLRQYSERLQFLHLVDEAILTAGSEKEVAQAVVDHIPDVIPGCFNANVTLLNFKDNEFSLVAMSDNENFELEEIWPIPDPSIWEHVQNDLLKDKEYTLDELKWLPVSSALIEYFSKNGIQSFIHYPILIKDQLIGTLNLGIGKKGSLESDEKELIKELLTPLAIGIEQARLHEKALEKNRHLLETVINNIPVSVMLIRGEDLKVLFANPSYYEITEGKNLVGKTLDDIWPDPDRDFTKLCRQVLASKKPFYVEDDHITVPHNSGPHPETAYFSWWLFPVDIPGEDEVGILNMAYETTDRKNAEEALVNAERLTTIGRMATSLAHEINNPIQSVVGCLGLAMENLEEGKDATQFMDVAMEELLRASQIVHRMRDLGRKREAKKEHKNINTLLEKVIILTQKKAQDQQIDVLWDEDKNLPLVPLIPDRIHQVFLNLVLNAIEAMPDGGSLRIGTSKTKAPPGIKITFTDTGKGISQEDQDQLFEPFHSTKQLGLGLGLYVSRRIIHSHHGEIKVDSEIEKGTTFTIWLPIETDWTKND